MGFGLSEFGIPPSPRRTLVAAKSLERCNIKLFERVHVTLVSVFIDENAHERDMHTLKKFYVTTLETLCRYQCTPRTWGYPKLRKSETHQISFFAKSYIRG